MSKRINAKHKIDRRLGVNLWGRPRARSTSARPLRVSTASAAASPLISVSS